MKKNSFLFIAMAAAMLTACSSENDLGPIKPDMTKTTPETTGNAQGWPSEYAGVMLQGFSWDSFSDTQWTNLTGQADELSKYFSLIWVPQSGNSNTNYNNMGYMPVYYFDQTSSFGTEEQLRNMIKTFKEKGTGIVADVVVNHRNNLGTNGSWVDYPAETYKGETYQMLPTDIVSNDDNGNTKTWADKQGISLSSRADEGEDWGGCRDLDHGSENVQKVIKAYVKYLKDDLGYTGFRYDMVKGFNGKHVGDYNDAANIEYSVGECWDSNDKIESWINTTNKKSAAFDFQFRYNVRDAINSNDWSKLNSRNNLIHDANYRRYAVTFVENHDMQDRGNASGYTKDPIVKDTLAANAYLLAMPGTPCVFLPHWKKYKEELKTMIDARKHAGITNTSDYKVLTASANLFKAEVTGKNAKLIVCVGPDAGAASAESGYTNILSGYHYAYLLENKATGTETSIFIDKAEGTYYNAVDVKVTAPSLASGSKLVYTLDGSAPTATSQVVPDNGLITLTNTAKLSVGVLTGSAVSNVISRNYTIQQFTAYTAKVYFKKPAGWSTAYIWAWDADNPALTGSSWPGVTMPTTTINGETWYYYDIPVNTPDYRFNVIFNQGTAEGAKQTVDIKDLTGTTYFELNGESEGKFTVVKVANP